MVLEPISIAATAGTLVATCARCTAYIWSITNQVQIVDTTIATLGVEITSLAQVLENIRISFEDPKVMKQALLLQTGHEERHWNSVHQAMKDCGESLEELEGIFNNLGSTTTWFAKLLKPKKMIKANMKEQDIALLKQQIAAYRRTMALSLQLITVSSVLNNEEHSISLMAKLESLEIDIHDIKSSLQQTPVPQISSTTNPVQTTKETEHLEAVISTASQVVSTAVQIVYQRSEASKLGDAAVPVSTDEKRDEVAKWLATSSNTILEEEPPWSPSTATHSVAPSDIFDPRIRRKTMDTELTIPSSSGGMKEYYGFGLYHVPEPEEGVEDGADGTGSVVGSCPSHPPSPPPMNSLLVVDKSRPSTIETVQESPAGSVSTDEIKLSPKLRVKTSQHDNSAGDLLLQEWLDIGLMKYSQGEYEESEQYLQRALQRCRSIYGLSSDRQSPILHTLSSALAHQGKCRAVETILDTTSSTADWKYSVVDILLTVSLEEGKSSQANQLISKYSQELLGRDDILIRLLCLCTKNMIWSVAYQIVERYRFRTRKSALETCITLTRQQQNWSYCAIFLKEQVKGSLEAGNEAEAACLFHALAEVYVELKENNTAKEFAQKAVSGRIKRGVESKEAQESIYLLARLVYEGGGQQLNRVEYYSAVKLLKHSTREKLELELLSRMDPLKAGSLFGHGLLKSMCEDEVFKRAKLDFESIRQNIKADGITRPSNAGSGDTLLHAFSNNGNYEAVDFLLRLGARVETLTKSGQQTALDLAVINNHENIIDLLLKNGATVELKDCDTTAIHKAATMGYRDSLRLLLQHAKPPSSWNAPTLLYQTALQGHQDTLQILLEYGAKDIRLMQEDYSPYFKRQAPIRSPRRRTALHEAITRGFAEGVIEMLINGENVLAVDIKDRTALHEAARLSGPHVVEMLIKGKADVSAMDSEGMTPLHIVALRGGDGDSGAVKITRLLLENRAPPDSTDDESHTPLDLAIFTSEILSPEIIKLLLEHNASITATDRLASKALQRMIFRATPEAIVVVNLFLNKNANVDSLLELRYNEEMYARLVGEETARRIMTRLSGARRRNTQAVNNAGGRQGSLWKRSRNPGRNTTLCKFGRSSIADGRIRMGRGIEDTRATSWNSSN